MVLYQVQETLAQELAAAALDLKVARRMFYGGFAGLPWLWFVLWVHFRHIAMAPTADRRLRKYVDWSLYGTICGSALFIAWVTFVQLRWRSWSSFGMSFMLIVPETTDDL